MPAPVKLLLIGNRGGTNVAESLERAAIVLGIEAQLFEANAAMGSVKWLNRVNWWLRGRRPTHLNRFSRDLLAFCKRHRNCADHSILLAFAWSVRCVPN
jgi:hypothetical protein